MSRAPLRVAVLGAGTVGTEVVRGLRELGDRLAPADGGALELTAIAVRNLDAARERGLPAEMLTDAPAHLIAADDTDVIVELMGGDEPAHTLIVAALGAGKAVVTANKHVIAHHGPELEGIARKTGAALRFEAAVAGGIPVLSPLASDLAANRIGRVRGIVNGTTNYILTAMAQEGRPYEDVLIDAQDLGYAEADPTGDVEGHDAVNKLVILARLAFDVWLDAGLDRGRAADGARHGPAGDHRRDRPGGRGGRRAGAVHQAARHGGADGRRDRRLGPPDRGAGRQPVRLDGRRDQPDRDRCRAARDGPACRTRRRGRRDEQRRARRPAGRGTRAAVDVGGPAAGRGTRRRRDRWARCRAPLVRVRAAGRDVPLPEALAEAASVSFEEGTALRTEAVTLADARAAFDAILPPGADVTLYPVDD